MIEDAVQDYNNANVNGNNDDSIEDNDNDNDNSIVSNRLSRPEQQSNNALIIYNNHPFSHNFCAIVTSTRQLIITLSSLCSFF